jgi:Na+/H+ antiporter NhaD/arsenite permease-like protein
MTVVRAAAVILSMVSVALRPAAVLPAARATAGPFVTLAAVIGCSAVANRLGAFRLAARLLIPGRAPRAVAAAAVLACTALLSALANLDVAVVVATPVAMRAARDHRLPAGRLAAAVAVTANAASFLLPTSNVTTLLLLARAPLPVLDYLRGSWLAWLLVAAITIGPLTAWLTRPGTAATRPARAAPGGPSARAAPGGPSARAALDLIPMFLIASAIRAMLAAGITLHAGTVGQLAAGAAIAAAITNLPAAAALHPAGTLGLWAAILATAIGPNLIITGSVATVICRRITRDAGAPFKAGLFTATGAALLPAQLAAAILGLHIVGALR